MHTDRRRFVTGLGVSGSVAWLGARVLPGLSTGLTSERDDAVSLRIGDEPIAMLPADFIGLGFEISSVARAGLLSASNHPYVQIVRTLSSKGVIRVGGNTSDDATLTADGPARSQPVGSVITKDDLRELGGFLGATGWRLLWGLNLGTGSKEAAAEEAAAVQRAAGDHLLGFEIGNEPDLFARNPTHRGPQYGYDDYLREFRAYRQAIVARVPAARFAGPDAADHTGWVEQFARDERTGVDLLTHHYYRECESPEATMAKLLGPDPKLLPELARLQAASHDSGLPYRICEVNSFCGGGRPGVSDTFGAALWALDYMCTLAGHGCSGVNMETGVNQRGFVSSYSPIADDERMHFAAAPEFYGMLAFRLAGGGEVRRVHWEPGPVNAAAYAFAHGRREVRIVIVNKEEHRGVRVRVPGMVREVVRLEGPGLGAKSGVTLGGSAVAADGTWAARDRSAGGAGDTVEVAAASAAIVVV